MSSWPSLWTLYIWENNPLSISSHANILSQSVGCFFVFSMVSFPGGPREESACNTGGSGSIPGLGRSPEEGNGNPSQYSWLENSMDSPWDCKELDTTDCKTLAVRKFLSLIRFQLFIFVSVSITLGGRRKKIFLQRMSECTLPVLL